MSIERSTTKDPEPKQTVFDRIINAIKDPRLPRKTAVTLAVLLVAVSVTVSNGRVSLSPMPSEASFPPSPIPTLTEAASPTPISTLTASTTSALEITPSLTPEPTPTISSTPEPTLRATPQESKPTPNPEAPENFTETEEMEAELNVLNGYRGCHDLPSLTYNGQLGYIANWKAQDLSITWPKLPEKGSPHIDSLGRDLGDRDSQMNLKDWLNAGENVEESNFSDPDINKNAQRIIDAWDASPKHKAILVDEWDYAGFGNYKDPKTGMHYVALEVKRSTHYNPGPIIRASQCTAPTPTPTMEPTPTSTIQPTPEPTPVITPVPTPSPTEQPTLTPTPEPTPIITPHPTATPEPSVAFSSNAVLVFDARRRIQQSRQTVYRRAG